MNTTVKLLIVLALAIAVGGVVILKHRNTEDNQADAKGHSQPEQNQRVDNDSKDDSSQIKESEANALPRLVDLGADKCIPCKMMAPILEEMKTEYAGRMEVEFIDVWKNPDAGKKYGIKLIPTQIFYDASGKELFRHVGFLAKEDILAKWQELGFTFTKETASSAAPEFERLKPAQIDNRPQNQICYMCDGDIREKTRVVVQTAKGAVDLCSPHCYFIMYSCLTEDKTDFAKKVSVTNWNTGKRISAPEAVFLYGQDEDTGRPWTQAFTDRTEAVKEQAVVGGNILKLQALQEKELSHRCGFCDRACYPHDAAEVIVDGGLHTWGCCSHCALGVAARTGKDIEVHERDRITGEPIVVKTLNGSVASIEPPTAVAWFGQRQKPDGTWGSAGCFHQGFFTSVEHLKQWVTAHPYETGRQITIQKALANKMKLSPQQISKACKIGECSPK